MIEAEFARDSKDFKRIEDEIQIDIINYLDPSSDYRLIVFIYDDSASVEEPRNFKKRYYEITSNSRRCYSIKPISPKAIVKANVC
jgi:hypothetical protein